MIQLIWCIILFHVTQSLLVEYQWKYVDYLWLNEEHRQAVIKSGNYDYTTNIMMDVDKAADGRLFVAVPREKGVPATLNTVSDQVGTGGPLLKPYPNWSWNNNSDCSGIISTYRNFIDKCDNLYVLDNGYIGDDKICPPKLLIFDLSTDKLLKRIIIPFEFALNKNGRGFLITPIVLRESCNEEPIVFMSDNEGHALVLWNGIEDKFKRFEGEVYNPQADAINMTINGEIVPMEDGVIGMTLISTPGKAVKLWFHPTSSFDMSSVDVSLLLSRNKEIKYSTVHNILPTQSLAMASIQQLLFFGLNSPPSIVCCNTAMKLTRQNLAILAENSETLQFASGIKVISNKELYVLTNRYQKYYAGTMNFNDVNIRILRGNVQNLIKNTKCANEE